MLVGLQADCDLGLADAAGHVIIDAKTQVAAGRIRAKQTALLASRRREGGVNVQHRVKVRASRLKSVLVILEEVKSSRKQRVSEEAGKDRIMYVREALTEGAMNLYMT